MIKADGETSGLVPEVTEWAHGQDGRDYAQAERIGTIGGAHSYEWMHEIRWFDNETNQWRWEQFSLMTHGNTPACSGLNPSP